MQGVFITGTGTDVGKTFIATEIARSLSRRDIRVIPKKPIESGCRKQGNELIPQDASALKEAANYPGALSDICPFCFEPPISPVRAAHLANKILTTEQLVSACLQGSETGFVLVEGAGGFYTPLAENGLNADLAVGLQLPVLLVADDRLGAISQVLLNVEAIQLRGLPLVGVVLNTLNNSQKDERDEFMDNAADLRERLNCPVYTSPFTKNGHAQLPEPLIESFIASAGTATSHISAVR